MKKDTSSKTSGGKICLMGASFETGNRGVSALAASFIKNVLEINPHAEIIFLMGNKVSKLSTPKISGRAIPVKIVNYRLSPKAKFKEHLLWIFLLAVLQRVVPLRFIKQRIIKSNPWLLAMDEAHIVCDIHGGDSFSDIYGFRSFIVFALEDIIALLMRKQLILLPQTYGPYSHMVARSIAKFIIKRSHKVYSRDSQSIELINELLGNNVNTVKIELCPDIAFTLDSVRLSKYHCEPPLTSETAPIVGFNINGLMYNGGYNRRNMFGLKCDYVAFVHNCVKKLLSETDFQILLIPHTFGQAGNINSDPDASRKLMSLLAESQKKRVHIVGRAYDESEIKGIIGRCDFFIGSRMHACIAALSQEIPTVGVAYSKKFVGVFQTAGVEECVIDGRFVDADMAADRVLATLQKRGIAKRNLQERMDLVREQIRTAFKDILNNHL